MLIFYFLALFAIAFAMNTNIETKVPGDMWQYFGKNGLNSEKSYSISEVAEGIKDIYMVLEVK